MSDTTPVAETTAAPETTAAVTPPEGKPQAQPDKPGDKRKRAEINIDKAFTALDRKTDRFKRDREAFLKERETFDSERQQLSSKAKELDELKAKLARVRSDEAAQKELLGEDFYDHLTKNRLDPEATERDRKLQAELQARDKKIDDLEKKIGDLLMQQQTNEQQAIAAEQRKHNLAGLQAAVDQLGDPALYLYSVEEMLEAAPAAVKELKAELEMGDDEWPTFLQIAERIAIDAKPRWQRATEAEKKRATKAADQAAPPAGKPATKEPAKEPTTVTTAAATKPAGKPRQLSKEEQEAEEDAEYMKSLWKKTDEEKQKKKAS